MSRARDIADRNPEDITVTGDATFDTNTLYVDSTNGNVLMGKTTQDFGATEGFEFYGVGGDTLTVLSRGSNAPLELRRNTSDGDILKFNKDGTTVGGIGTGLSSLSVGTGNTQLMFWNAQSGIFPSNGTTVTDNSIDFGNPNYRFKDLYLSGLITSVGIYNNTSGGSANLGVSSSGELYRSTSSLRYKTDITDATHGLTDLLSLRPVTYRDASGGETVYGGLIAEEVHAAGLTEFVEYNADGEPDALAYANMVSLCIKAIQEQQTKIEALEAEVTSVKARLDALEAK